MTTSACLRREPHGYFHIKSAALASGQWQRRVWTLPFHLSINTEHKADQAPGTVFQVFGMTPIQPNSYSGVCSIHCATNWQPSCWYNQNTHFFSHVIFVTSLHCNAGWTLAPSSRLSAGGLHNRKKEGERQFENGMISCRNIILRYCYTAWKPTILLQPT